MTDDERLDALLARALETGENPSMVDAAEQAEIEGALAAARGLQSHRAEVANEAEASLPAARARFARGMAAEQSASATPVPVSRVRGRPVRPGWFGTRRSALLAAAVIAVLAIVTTAGLRNFAADVETASALEPGDYVQLQGVVAEAADTASGRAITVTSEVGDLQVDLSDATSVVEGEAAVEPGAVKPGLSVVIGGTVGGDGRILAQTLVLAAAREVRAQPLERPGRQPGGIEGRILSLAVSEDGSRGRVTVETPNGRRVVVDVDERSVYRLLADEAVLGARIAVARLEGADAGVFSLTLLQPGNDPGLPPAAAALTSVRGTVTARDGETLRVQSGIRGDITVALRPGTRYLGARGERLAAILAGEAIVGQEVAVTGAFDRQTRTLHAGLVVISGGR